MAHSAPLSAVAENVLTLPQGGGYVSGGYAEDQYPEGLLLSRRLSLASALGVPVALADWWTLGDVDWIEGQLRGR